MTTAELPGRITVQACIACGTRFRGGECDDGCADVALELVDAGPVDELAAHVDGLRRRVEALRALRAGSDAPLPELRERARAALHIAVPPRDPDVRIVEAWGCPKCARVDALQPCLGVCVRLPLEMDDAGEYRRLAAVADELAGEERSLARAARLVVNVRPRSGYEQTTDAALRALLTAPGREGQADVGPARRDPLVAALGARHGQPQVLRHGRTPDVSEFLGRPVSTFPDGTRTAADAAAAIGCDVAQIVKSLVFRKQSGGALLVLTSGRNRVDEAKVGELVAEPIAKADAAFVREVTGYAIGGVPPAGHPAPIDTLVDRDLLPLGEVWAAAGTPRTVFPIGADDLVRLTGGRVADVAA
jgi:prolyl-tRNA editing enzyme YbaK/EbsC (Cys-tRNA(Pro) deacylase)